MLLVHPSVPVATVKELVAYAKARPGALNFGSSGTGSVGHMAAELFQVVTGTRFSHVPYKGAAPSVNDLLAGRIQLMFIGPTLVPHVKSKKLKALAMGGDKRLPALEEVPTFAEAGYPEVDAAQWYGVVTTAGTPRAVIERLNREIVAAVQRPDVRDKLLDLGFDPAPSTAQEFSKIIRDDLARWQKVVKAAGIKPE
jgi:tripartite-type tricarboxylate transporter receptor subunit TctC